ncbi:YdeI/OmpD-associated family protein [Paenibacillus sp. N1-5-1-14]|uniref:YdeI/OmpD-associated family protein n=1 Tax=Paenibacillus radicibacter TaxID=2972488 RepID=UPI0021594284|nr:YdeI/OmpD-associated family protein [Paenibacillus radicibacter]MCR8642884.1 YdeI/OmpD-associated family protein [Paenibacillus radicibacter]
MTKTIVEKLKLHQFCQVAVMYKPEGSDYLAELSGYDTQLQQGTSYDMIFAFVLDMEALRALVNDVIEQGYLNAGGYLFTAYPKKGNKVYSTFIHRDELLEGLGSDENGYVGTSTVKFARMVGLDDVFTVVGFKEDAKGKAKLDKPSSTASQRVDDYIAMIPDVEKDLSSRPDLLAFYQSLTPGYKKDWARYVYSAKQEETRENRREEMKTILSEGYKTRELYRKGQIQ